MQEKEVVESLTALVEEIDAMRRELQGQLTVLDERARRAGRALAALKGAAPPTGKPRKHYRRKQSQDARRAPRIDTQQAVLTALRRCGPEGGTLQSIQGYSGLSMSTVDRTLRYLRSHRGGEKVRKAGVGGEKNTAFLYKLMNGGSNGAS